MRQKTVKIILTIILFIISIPIVGGLNYLIGRNASDGVGGIVGIIYLLGLLAGLRAIWKYKSKNDKYSDDERFKLDKD